MIIESEFRRWKKTPDGKYLPGVFQFPEGVVVRFPDGDEYCSEDGPRDRVATTMEGSPVHQALVAAGLELVRIN